LRFVTAVIIAVKQKNTDNDQDDGSDQESPVLKGREEMDDKINYEKNDPDTAYDPARQGLPVYQEKAYANGHQKKRPGSLLESKDIQVIQN
jgi:hypothetical protein